MNILDDLRQKRATLEEQIEGLFSAEDFDPSDETFARAKAEAEALDSRIKAIVEFEQRKSAANEIDAISVRSRKSADQQRRADSEGRSIGDIFVRSREYLDYREAPRGTSGHVQVPMDLVRQDRAPILTDTFPGVLEPQRIAPSAPPALQTPILDSVSRIPVASNSVEWIFYPAAAPVAGDVAEGAGKPEATVNPELKTVSLTIQAHHLTVSRSTMEDGGALMAYIDAALRRGVLDKIEGNAAAAIVGAADIPAVTYGGGGDGSVDNLLKGIRVGVGAVQDAGFAPSIVLLNPMDFALMDIDVLGATLLGPTVGSQFWGVRPVAAGAIPAGTAFVGDMATAVAHLYRSEVQMYVTDSHASNFTSNLITLLAEARSATIVHRPEAAVEVKAGA